MDKEVKVILVKNWIINLIIEFINHKKLKENEDDNVVLDILYFILKSVYELKVV